MATPITWRTVQGASLAEASRPMQLAQLGLNSAIGQLGQVVSDRQAVNQGVADRQEEANVQNFLDTVAKAQTPEQVAALRASGQLDTLRQAIAPKNLGRVRGADEARESSLMQQIGVRNTFNDQALDREQAPLRDQVMSFAAQGKSKEALAVLEANPGLRNAAEVHKAIVGGERDFTRFGWEAAGQKRSEETHVRQGQTHKQNLTLGGLRIAGQQLENENAQLTAKDARELRSLQDTVSAAQQGYLENQRVRGAALGVLANRLGFPVDAAGMPRMEDMTSDQITRLNSEATTQGIPTLKDFAGGDTRSGQQFYDDLAKSGKYTPALLARTRQNILGGFDTTQIGKPGGNDAAAINLSAARNKVAFDEKDAANWYAPGSPDVKKNFEDLATQVPTLIDKSTGIDSAEDVAGIQEFVYKMATQGLEVSPGVFLTPSVNDMKNFIRTAEGGWFSDSKRAENAEAALKKSLSSSRVTELVQQAEESKAYRRKQAVRDILSPKK